MKQLKSLYYLTVFYLHVSRHKSCVFVADICFLFWHHSHREREREHSQMKEKNMLLFVITDRCHGSLYLFDGRKQWKYTGEKKEIRSHIYTSQAATTFSRQYLLLFVYLQQFHFIREYFVLDFFFFCSIVVAFYGYTLLIRRFKMKNRNHNREWNRSWFKRSYKSSCTVKTRQLHNTYAQLLCSMLS